MAGELGERERRYIEAYLELESRSTATRAGTRERVLATALGELGEAGELAESGEHRERRKRSARSRGTPRGTWLAAGLGLCAAAAMLAWWSGRASLVEEQARRVHEQASRVSDDERSVHEVAASSRRGASASEASEASEAAATESSVDPRRSLPAAAEAYRDPLRPSSVSGSPRRPDSAGTARRRADAHADPSEPVPTLADAEVALLERARELARQGEHAAALAVLREHAQGYPRSVLGPERTAEEVAVLCRMGAASAESARVSFLAGDPPQYLRLRVEKACTP